MSLLLALFAALVALRSAGAAVSSQEFEIATLSEDQWSPAISDAVVVWEDQRNFPSDIFGRDLESGQKFPISTAPESQQRPVISGDTVVWEDHRNGDSDIYGYDLDGGEEFRITRDAADQRRPAISGDTVVWEDRRNGDSNIYGETLKDRREFRVTVATGWQDTPKISGETVVWRDDRNNGHYDIYGRDLSESGGFRITTDTSDQVSPDVSGHVVVWADGRDADLDIYGKDLSTGEEFAVSTDSGPQSSPAIDVETIVWEQTRSGDAGFGTYDIHGCGLDIAPAAPAALQAEGSPSGVSLRWNANREDDLAGYNVYRSGSPEGPYTRLNPAPLTTPSYSDKNAPRGSVSHYRVRAIDGAGSESASSTASAAAIAPSSITLKAKRSRPGLARLTGRLTSGPEALPDQRIILLQRPKGDRGFSRVRGVRIRTNERGMFSRRVRPHKNAVYRARFNGDPEAGLGRSVSAPRQVRARPTATLRLSDRRLKPGGRVIISGRVRPAHRGSIRLSIGGSRKRVTDESVSLSRFRFARTVPLRHSRYRIPYRPPGPGRYTVRVSFARHADHPGARGSVREFRMSR